LRLLPKGAGRWDTPKTVCWTCHARIIVPTGNFHLRWTNLAPVAEKDCQAASDCGTVAREILTSTMRAIDPNRQ